MMVLEKKEISIDSKSSKSTLLHLMGYITDYGNTLHKSGKSQKLQDNGLIKI